MEHLYKKHRRNYLVSAFRLDNDGKSHGIEMQFNTYLLIMGLLQTRLIVDPYLSADDWITEWHKR